jgi:hypothetical protein
VRKVSLKGLGLALRMGKKFTRSAAREVARKLEISRFGGILQYFWFQGRASEG